MMHPARKQEPLPTQPGLISPSGNRLASLLGDLELDGPLSILLHNDCPRHDVTTVVHIANT